MIDRIDCFEKKHSHEILQCFPTAWIDKKRAPSFLPTMLIEWKGSPIHGLGGFARADLAPGTRLIAYVGRKISKAESLRQCHLRNPFIFYLDATHDLDGNVEWNPARFLNHSCDPNSDAELTDGEIWIVAQRPIGGGEEITFDYGYDLENYRDYPCCCGAPNCVGYIISREFHDQVRRSRPG